MKILHISDTHGIHSSLDLDGVDVIAFTGDESNYREPIMNEKEFYRWFEWFESLDVWTKLYIPGNHSAYVYNNESYVKGLFKENGIEWLHQRRFVLDGVVFYGDAYSPLFGNWYYMKQRNRLHDIWEAIPDDVNVLLTHTPPKGILDLAHRPNRTVEQAGCNNLFKRIKKLKDLKLHLFGHIHDNGELINFGVLKRYDILFSNGTLVEDDTLTKYWTDAPNWTNVPNIFEING